MNYKESKEKLDKIRDDYGCKGEIIFRTALQIVVEAGQCTILDDTWYLTEIDDINAKHDVAEKEGKILFITRDFEIAILKCAREIAEIPTIDLLQYVQKEVWLSGDGIDYQRMKHIATVSIDWITSNDIDSEAILDHLRMLDLTDDEIVEFGYEWVLDKEEE